MRFVKDYADDIYKFLKIIFQNSYNTGDLPQDPLAHSRCPTNFQKGQKKA